MNTITTPNPYASTIARLETLVNQLLECKTVYEKLAVLEATREVSQFLGQKKQLESQLSALNSYERYALFSLFAVEQGPILFGGLEGNGHVYAHLSALVKALLDIEKFYGSIGGIIGYHLAILRLLDQNHKGSLAISKTRFLKPQGLSLEPDTESVRRAILSGLQALPHFSVIFPVGGAGDRLNLVDPATDEALPSARLLFGGRTLLEGLIRILQGWEYFYYKLHGKQLQIPIVLMTSHEKNNQEHIQNILEKERWFGRAQKRFFSFVQPLVPMLTIEGNWACTAPLRPMLKPGGHGALWKLCVDSGAFDFLTEHGVSEALILQINNPLLSVNGGMLAFMGKGHTSEKDFGFLGCERVKDRAEGMIVLKEEEKEGSYHYCLTNVEYTEFQKQGIQEEEALEYPANPNILYARINAVKNLIEKQPIPGMLINLKHEAPCLDVKGHRYKATACRLESTMQNIADGISVQKSEPIKENVLDDLSSFFVMSPRYKTLSVTKKSFVPGGEIFETPEGAFYDLQMAMGKLLLDLCLMEMPSLGTTEEFIEKGPGYLFMSHPSLGPLWSVIAQKLRGGIFRENAELQLEIAEVDISQLDLKGSLLIHSDATLGEKGPDEVIVYSEISGKCELHGVKVRNAGINRSQANIYWKNQIQREEALRIHLHGNAEFFACDVTFDGDQTIEVPDSHRLTAEEVDGEVQFILKKIKTPTWHWGYTTRGDGEVMIEKMRIPIEAQE